MDPKNLAAAGIPRNLLGLILDELADRILDELADRVAARLRDGMPRASEAPVYTKHAPPPGVTWRSARETAAREGIPTRRIGRVLVIDRTAWDARFGLGVPPTAAPAVPKDDLETLRAMGVVVPMNRRAS